MSELIKTIETSLPLIAFAVGSYAVLMLVNNAKNIRPPGEGDITQELYQEIEGTKVLGEDCSRDSSCSQNMTTIGPGGGLFSKVGCVRGKCDLRESSGVGFLYFDKPPCSEYTPEEKNILIQNDTYTSDFRPSSDGSRCNQAAYIGQRINILDDADEYYQGATRPLGARCNVTSECSSNELTGGPSSDGQNVVCSSSGYCSRVNLLE